MDKYELAFNEWHDKTEWVQGDKRFDVINPWGKHRADVLKLYIDNLESNLEDAEKRIAELEEKQRLIDICQGQGLEHRIAAEKRAEAAEQRVAELGANNGKPVMFIDGDISPADADKLAAVIREFNEETETPAARMARIIRENPHPTNMCDMPAAGIGVKGE